MHVQKTFEIYRYIFVVIIMIIFHIVKKKKKKKETPKTEIRSNILLMVWNLYVPL